MHFAHCQLSALRLTREFYWSIFPKVARSSHSDTSTALGGLDRSAHPPTRTQDGTRSSLGLTDQVSISPATHYVQSLPSLPGESAPGPRSSKGHASMRIPWYVIAGLAPRTRGGEREPLENKLRAYSGWGFLSGVGDGVCNPPPPPPPFACGEIEKGSLLETFHLASNGRLSVQGSEQAAAVLVLIRNTPVMLSFPHTDRKTNAPC